LSIDRDQAEINPATNDRKRPGARPARKGCGPACKRDPVSGVIGV